MKKVLTYEIVKRKVFKEDKWMISLRRHKKRSLKKTTETVALRTTSSPSDIEGLLQAYLEQIRYHVLSGESVNINGFGTFYPKVTAKLVDKEEDATVNNCVQSVTIGFRPCTELKEAIKESGFAEFSPAKDANKKRR
ncbi:MAG: HU family DNA-binding protein [Bacteroidales bacterium]|nr:HU family DNA-binding protein [Bacteroidales bacterium]